MDAPLCPSLVEIRWMRIFSFLSDFDEAVAAEETVLIDRLDHAFESFPYLQILYILLDFHGVAPDMDLLFIVDAHLAVVEA
jgi:hypothetical protein